MWYVIIHCEESDAARQHFYPPSILNTYTSTHQRCNTTILRHFPPSRTLSTKFIFPLFIETDSEPDVDGKLESNLPLLVHFPLTPSVVAGF